MLNELSAGISSLPFHLWLAISSFTLLYVNVEVFLLFSFIIGKVYVLISVSLLFCFLFVEFVYVHICASEDPSS